MVEVRLLAPFVCRFLLSMFFSNPGNGGGITVEGKGGSGIFSGSSGGSGFWATTTGDASKVAIAVTAMAGLALAATIIYSRRSVLYVAVAPPQSSSSSSLPVPDRGNLKSPWSRRRRKHALSPQQWESLLSPDGKLRDGVKFLKKVRSGGVDPSIRPEVWPFLLGVYSLKSSKAERNVIRMKKRKEYENLRRQCRRLSKQSNESFKKSKEVGGSQSRESSSFNQNPDSPGSEDVVSARQSLSMEGASPDNLEADLQVHEEASHSKTLMEEEEEEDNESGITYIDAYAADSESSGFESSGEESESAQLLRATEEIEESNPKVTKTDSFNGRSFKVHTAEDFATWQRIIRLDAVRANAEWIVYSPSQAGVPEEKAHELAEAVGLKDYDHLDPCRIFHAARLVAILEAYAVYDPEIGYCQGMSDLLSPIIAVIEEDYEAFWCFVGFMRKARHNFRLDEVGIRRQLNTVSKIIKSKDSHLYRHLEKLQAEDCFFVYRMVVVMFRRELNFEQTLCLWEVMWADQAAIRSGIGKSAWGRIRMRAPPTEDLLLYAIAASVLQRRKLIIEKYSSMDEILRECNSMAGQLDVWKLLDDAHDLVVTLHDKI